MAERRPGDLRRLLIAALNGRKEIRWGEERPLAAKLGYSVRGLKNAMAALGIVVVYPEKPRCLDCGKVIGPTKSGVCLACLHKRRTVVLTCVNCGRAFERSRREHERFLLRKAPQGRRGPVCSRECSSRVMKTCSWCGEPCGIDWRCEVRPLAWCRPPKRCFSEAMREIQNRHWRHIMPDLLPMKDHTDEIAALRVSLVKKD